MEIEKYSPKWLLEKINNSKNDAHKLMHIIEYSKEIIKSTDQQLILSGVVKSDSEQLKIDKYNEPLTGKKGTDISSSVGDSLDDF